MSEYYSHSSLEFWITNGAPFLVNVTSLKLELRSKLRRLLSGLQMLITPTDKHLEHKNFIPLTALATAGS